MPTHKAATRTQIISIIQAYSGNDAIIPIPRVYIELCGDYNRAAILNQILYWSERTNDKNGWFYKSYDDWQTELGLSKYQVTRAVQGDKRSKNNDQALENLGVQTTIRKAPNGAPTTHYRVDEEIFVAKLMEVIDGLNPIVNNVNNGKSTSPLFNNQQCSRSSYTETTTENTDADAQTEEQNDDTKIITFLVQDDSVKQPLPIEEKEKSVSPSETVFGELKQPYSSDEYAKRDAARDEIKSAYFDANNMTTKRIRSRDDKERLEELISAGVTAEDIRDFIEEKRRDDFWRDKTITLKVIARDIGAWKKAHKPRRKVKTVIGPLPTPPEYIHAIDLDGAA